MERRKTNFLTAGWLNFGIGLFVFILCLVILIVNARNDGVPWILALSIVGLTFSELAVDIGIILMVVGYAVFSKKISNREKAIKEYEKNNKE